MFFFSECGEKDWKLKLLVSLIMCIMMLPLVRPRMMMMMMWRQVWVGESVRIVERHIVRHWHWTIHRYRSVNRIRLINWKGNLQIESKSGLNYSPLCYPGYIKLTSRVGIKTSCKKHLKPAPAVFCRKLFSSSFSFSSNAQNSFPF